jgi:mono/diheme cytochrome c family protein
MEDYIVATVSSGRLASTRPNEYPGGGVPAMPAFHENLGGPLREDQVRDLAAYIINWEPTAQTISAPKLDGPAVGSDITKTLPAGDATKGEALATSLGCVGCHVLGNTGPAWAATGSEPGVASRAATRISQADYTGAATTADQYLFEAIVNPAVYLSPNFTNLMPATYSTQMTEQDMADLLAYLLTFK